MSRSTHSAVADDRNADVQIYVNGEFFHRSEAKISVFDSGRRARAERAGGTAISRRYRWDLGSIKR